MEVSLSAVPRLAARQVVPVELVTHSLERSEAIEGVVFRVCDVA